MTFKLTPEEAQPLVNRIAKFYIKKGHVVKIEKPISFNAPYTPTIIAKKNHLQILIEVQSRLNYSDSIKSLAGWMAINRMCCELYLALEFDAVLSGAHLSESRKDGVGILLVKDKDVESYQKAKNHALIVNLDPSFKFGKFASAVHQSIKKFNEVDRKDGLRDLCEIFETAIEELGLKLCKKNKFKSLDEKGFKRKTLEEQINILSTNNAYLSGIAMIEESLKTDLHSFRNARNLLDHKVSKSNELKRLRLCVDKMLQGARLIDDLEKLKRQVR